MNRKKIICWFLVLFTLVWFASAFPLIIDQQGKITNLSDSSPVNGTMKVNATFYNFSDDSAVYSENITLPVINGTYNYIIGTINGLNKEMFRSDLYVKMKIDDDVMSPANVTYTPKCIYGLLCNESDNFGGEGPDYWHGSINNNWTNLNANLTQLWQNISAMNTSLGAKGTGSSDGSKISNGTDASLIVVNASIVNATFGNFTGLSGSLGWTWLDGVPSYVRDYTSNILDNATKLRAEIATNITVLQNNDTQIWTNISAINTSLGLKLESDDDSSYLQNNTDATMINVTTSSSFTAEGNISISDGTNTYYWYIDNSGNLVLAKK